MAFNPCPTITVVGYTGSTTGVGLMSNTAMNHIGVTPQNAPNTGQPTWVAAPLISTGGSDGTDVYTTG